MGTRVSLGLALTLALGAGWVAGAAATESSALAYFERAGVRAQFEQAKAMEAQQARQLVQQLMAQMESQMPEISAELRTELEKITADMVDALLDAYTVQELLEVYAAPFDRAYPKGFEKEMSTLATPEGQRLVATLNEAIAATYSFRAQRQQEVMNRESQKLIQRVRELAVPRAP